MHSHDQFARFPHSLMWDRRLNLHGADRNNRRVANYLSLTHSEHILAYNLRAHYTRRRYRPDIAPLELILDSNPTPSSVLDASQLHGRPVYIAIVPATTPRRYS